MLSALQTLYVTLPLPLSASVVEVCETCFRVTSFLYTTKAEAPPDTQLRFAVFAPRLEVTVTARFVGAVGAPGFREYSRRLGDPRPALPTTFWVLLARIVLVTTLGVAPLSSSMTRAAAPATCGDAIEVPLILFTAVVLVLHVDVILLPGAKMSRQDP